MQKSTKKWGGHTTGFREDISTGGGPVFLVRATLGISQTEMAKRLGASAAGVAKWEKLGAAPRIAAQLQNLERLAREAGIDLSEGE